LSIWALADLHLSLGDPSKDMSFFGPPWEGYVQKMEYNWKKKVSTEDLVLLPGDISWAKTLEGAEEDLAWIDHLPGTKVMIRGNHDYWWSSRAKMEQVLPPSIHCIHNDSFIWQDIAIGGARLWDTQEYQFLSFIDRKTNLREVIKDIDVQQEQKIFRRELERLERSLQSFPSSARFRIAMTHYPPIGAFLKDSEASRVLEKFQVDVCVFGHLHSVHHASLPFGEKGGVRYLFVSADYVDFTPIKVC